MIGGSYWNEATINWDGLAPNVRAEVTKYIEEMHLLEPKGVGFVFYGDHGRGKTSLATVILRNALARGGYALSVRASDLVDNLLSKVTVFLPNGAALLDGLRHVNYLLIDDLIKEDLNYRLRHLESVLRWRNDERLPTIITTNLSTEALASEGWRRSLLSDKSRWRGIRLTGEDARKS